MKYVGKKRTKIFDVIEIDSLKGYKFSPKSKVIKSIEVCDEKLMNEIASGKVNSMFKRVLMIVNNAFDSDDDMEGTSIALDEIAFLKSQLLNKYNRYLSKEKQELFLKKLLLLEEEMQMKMIMYQTSFANSYPNQGKSR